MFWPYNFYLVKFFIYKNLHIEPFCYAIKRVCFDFHSTNMGSSVIKMGRSEGSLLPYIEWFNMQVFIYKKIPKKTIL